MKEQESICIIGLGYVGMTLAVAFAEVGINVYGVEINEEVLSCLDNGKAHFKEQGLDSPLADSLKSGLFKYGKEIPKANNFSSYIITVGTPLDSSGTPRIDMVLNATKQVIGAMNDDSLIILRSTVSIGVTAIIDNELSLTDKNYHIAMCPERTLEGKALEELRTLPQIIGTSNEDTKIRCNKLFSYLTPKIVHVASWETAEIIKLCDNTYRDVSFAFANEISKVCDAYSVDCYEVINSGKVDYSRTNIPLPGPVGGPCLEKDPHIFSLAAKAKNVDMHITNASRKTNESQLKLVADSLKESIARKSARILLCGLAFKGVPETNDLRGSMGLKFLDEFNHNDFDIFLSDPIVSDNDLSKYGNVCDLNNSQEKFDLICILNNHPHFKNNGIEYFKSRLNETGFIFDFWNNFYHLPLKSLGNNYIHLGNLGSINK